MKRIVTIFAGVLLASCLLAGAAEARGFAGDHMGGFGRSEIGSAERGLHGHAMNNSNGYSFRNSLGQSCYYPDEAPKAPPWPPFCG